MDAQDVGEALADVVVIVDEQHADAGERADGARHGRDHRRRE
jgi:hypothetical protein